ncbi:MAG: DUF4267 domain-containing protein [Candidatus Eremiobacteraeota bacterium]|nr:DUF4267 domain-containing protein [Candidatus Eremiobacteraeota bacterium]
MKVAALVALGFVAVGAGALAAPRRSSAQYGLPVCDERTVAYVRALGARDLVLGLLLATLLGRRAHPRAIAGALGLSALIGAADFVLVATTPAANRKALPLHAAGTLALVMLALALTRNPAPPFDPSR